MSDKFKELDPKEMDTTNGGSLEDITHKAISSLRITKLLEYLFDRRF